MKFSELIKNVVNALKKINRKAIWETTKFVTRTVLLVGVPAVLAELAKSRPEWGAYIGILLLILDKLLHESPNKKITGIVPF